MKKFLILIAILIIGFSSCKKEELDTPPPSDDSTFIEVSILNKWVLVDATMYFRNLETNQWYSMSHFGPDRTVSSLRYSGVMFEIERIEQFVTTWEFKAPPSIPGTGEFILDNDTINPYGFYMTAHNWTIIEHPLCGENTQLGGSSRPINVYVIDENYIMIQIEQVYESIGGYNHVYFSELKFQKVL